MRNLSVRVGLTIVVLVVGGCTKPPRGSKYVSDPDPTVKIPAIHRSVEERNAKALPTLVKDLASDDPAVRFYVIGALMKFTGGDAMGYVYYASPEDRAPAIERWKAWLAQREETHTAP